MQPRRLLEHLALVSYDEPLPVDEQHPEAETYKVMGILPMMWQWAKDVADSATYDLSITLHIISDDHPRLRPLLNPLARRLH